MPDEDDNDCADCYVTLTCLPGHEPTDPPLCHECEKERLRKRIAELEVERDKLSEAHLQLVTGPLRTMEERAEKAEAQLVGAPTQPAPTSRLEDLRVWGYAEHEDAERWYGSCATKEAAIAEGRAEYGRHVHFVVRPGTRYAARRFMPDAEDLIEMMGDRASDEAGDAAEEFPDVGEYARKDFEAVLDAWADKHLGVCLFWVADGPVEDVGENEHNDPPVPLEGQLALFTAVPMFPCCGGTDGGQHTADCSERPQDDCETED